MEPFKPEIDILKEHGIASFYGEPMIFHCNHYNLFLQRSIEDAGGYIHSKKILVEGATAYVYNLLQNIFDVHKEIKAPLDRLRTASDLYSLLGFGLLPIENLNEKGGFVITPITHYSIAWRKKWGKRSIPVDFFTCGYLQAALASAYYRSPGCYHAEQTKCVSMGNKACEFKVSTVADFKSAPYSPGLGVLFRKRTKHSPIPTNVDAQAITDAVRGMPIVGNADGLIPAFGVYLTRHSANYYNYISYEAIRMIIEATNEEDLAKDLFIEAGNVCAFNTLGGIMESEEWRGLIQPQCKNREDWVSAIIACANALGWGFFRATNLTPGEQMVLRVDGGYESNGHLRMYGKAVHPNSYFVTGLAAGIMSLLYHADVTQHPALTEEFYYDKFTKKGSFIGTQKKCRSMGDPYCEIKATRGQFTRYKTD